VRVFDAAVAKAYGGRRKISWLEVFAGEESFKRFQTWLPDATVAAFKEYLVGIKGPLTTPVGGGIRSLNVALRQLLDLYVCLRPVRWFNGVPSPVRHPEKVNMVIFRENTEDIYAGLDFEAGGEAAIKTLAFLRETCPAEFKKIRFGGTPELVGVGIKTVSKPGTQRLARAAVEYAIAQGRKSVTFVHKGNIMKYTEPARLDSLKNHHWRRRHVARTRRADCAIYSRRRHRPRHLGGECARTRRGGHEGIRRRARDCVARGVRGRGGF